MAPTKHVLQCKANRILVDRLQNDVELYLELKRERMVITLRRAIQSIMECPNPIRCKEDAKGLKGVGVFIAERIESILYRERLLNVPAIDPDELIPEEHISEVKKSDISGYVPRQGSLSHFILISILMLTCENEDYSVEIDTIKSKIAEIDSQLSYNNRRFSDYLRVLEGHGLLRRQNTIVSLTEMGEKLGVLCLKDCRLSYPAVESFMEENKLSHLEHITRVPLVPTPTPALQQPTSLELPALHWPLPPPPADLCMGEYKPEETMEEIEPLPAFTPVEVTSEEKEWEVLLLLDNREVRNQHDRSFLENQLQGIGVNCEKRSLSLGDMQWVLHHLPTGREVMLNVIIERKNTRDLAASILDGRFNEQQYRLLNCGCVVVIYLIEGGVRSQDVLPADSLQTAIMTTVVNRGIYVYQSTSIDDTVIFLKGVHDIVGLWVHNYFTVFDTKCFHPLRISYSDFQTRNTKTKSTKAKSLWCRQLRQIPRCTPVKSILIVKQYPTMASLLNAYNTLTTVKEREELLKNICDKKKQNCIGLALSKSIYHFLCDK